MNRDSTYGTNNENPVTQSNKSTAQNSHGTSSASDVSKMAVCRMSSPTRICLVLSLSFAFVYTAYLAIQNLQTSLNKEANLGVASLSVLYGTIILFGTQTPTFVRLFGPKRILLAAWLIHIVYTATNFYPSWYTLIPSSALMGAIAAPMWTSQGLYITSAGEQYASLRGLTSEKSLHSVLSKFNGIFFMAYEVTQVTGNLISSLVLSSGTHSNISAQDIQKCGANDCFSTPGGSSSNNSNSNSTSDPTNERPQDVVYTLLGIFLVFNVCGFLCTAIGLPSRSESRPEVQDSPCGELMSCARTTVSLKMLPLIPLFMAQAMAVGVLYADYTKAYISCALGVEWVGYVMASYGLLCAVFAVSINYLAKYAGRFPLFVVAILMDTATLLIMLLWKPSIDTSIATFFLVPALSGVSEGIMQAQFNTIIAQLFRDNMSPAFATYHTSKAASFTLTFTLSLFMCLRHRLLIAIALYGLGLAGYMFTEFRFRRGAWQEVKLGSSADDALEAKQSINKLSLTLDT